MPQLSDAGPAVSSMSFSLAKHCNVEKVLWPSSRQFRRNQVLGGNKRSRQAAWDVDDSVDAMVPCALEIDAADFRKDIHHDGRAP